MSLFAGAKVRASDQITAIEAFASSALALTTTITDIPGCSITFNTVKANQVFKVTCVFDMRVTALGGGYQHGRVNYDGADHARQAIWIAQGVESRWVGGFSMLAVLAAAGSHTVKLRGSKDVAGGTCSIESGLSTTLIIETYP